MKELRELDNIFTGIRSNKKSNLEKFIGRQHIYLNQNTNLKAFKREVFKTKGAHLKLFISKSVNGKLKNSK